MEGLPLEILFYGGVPDRKCMLTVTHGIAVKRTIFRCTLTGKYSVSGRIA